VAPHSPEESSALPKWRNGVRGLPHLQTSIEFSPDARFVFATSFHGQSIAVDLTKKTGIRLKEFFPTLDERSFHFIGPDRVVQEGSKTGDSSILSFPAGGPVGKIPNVVRVTLASDPRYAFTGGRKSNQTGVIDLQAGSVVQKLQGEKADILDSDLVRNDHAHDEIILSQNGDPKPTETTNVTGRLDFYQRERGFQRSSVSSYRRTRRRSGISDLCRRPQSQSR
jgi:hypothetical protein